MKKFVPILSVSCLSLLLNSCGLFPSSEQAQEQNPTPVKEVTPPPPTPPPATFQPTAPNDVGAFSLIPSTDPESRLKAIEKGRSDPFALPALGLIITPKPVLPSKSVNLVAANTASRPVATPNVLDSCVVPRERTNKPLESQQIVYHGGVQFTSHTTGIIKTPDEIPRTVRVGEYISGGRVLVASISPDIIVFKESGQTVSRSVNNQSVEEANTGPVYALAKTIKPELQLSEVQFVDISSVSATQSSERGVSGKSDGWEKETVARVATIRGQICNNTPQTLSVSSVTLQITKGDKVVQDVEIQLNPGGVLTKLNPGILRVFKDTIEISDLAGEVTVTLTGFSASP